MDFSQILGFLITIAAILYMFIKRAKDRHERSHTDEDDTHDEPHQAEKLKDFLKSLEIDMDESKDFKSAPKSKVSKPKPSPIYSEMPRPKHKAETFQEEFNFKTDIENFKMKTNIEERKLKIGIKNDYEENYGEHLLSTQFRGEKIKGLIGYKRPSKIKRLIHSLPSKKDIVLLHEVLDKPKGLKF